jgi:hypothetical protein
MNISKMLFEYCQERRITMQPLYMPPHIVPLSKRRALESRNMFHYRVFVAWIKVVKKNKGGSLTGVARCKKGKNSMVYGENRKGRQERGRRWT